jgi:CRP-like cAMP-binding protein
MLKRNDIYDELNMLRHENLERIKEYITGNYDERNAQIVSHLFDLLLCFGPLPQNFTDKDLDSLFDYLVPLITTSYYSRRQLLLSAGQVSQYIYFLQKGLARGFYTDQKTGREVTDFLWHQGSLITVPGSFFEQKPSQLFIEVMPETELLSISYNDLMPCIKTYPLMELFLRNVILRYNAHTTRRSHQLVFLSAWERYLELLKTHPDIEQQVSKEVIASYLHITPQSLSRMLKEKRHP